VKAVKRRRIEAFIEIASTKKAWLLATSLLIAALSYVSHFVMSSPTSRIDQEESLAGFNSAIAEDEAAVRLDEQTLVALKSYTETFRTYNALIGDKQDNSPLPTSAIKTALNDLRKTRRDVNVALGMLQGTRLSEPALDSYRAEFIANVTSMDSALDILEQLYASLLACDAKLTNVSLDRLTGPAHQSEANAARIVAAFHGFYLAATVAIDRQRALKHRLEAEHQQLLLNTVIAVLALMIIATYLVVAFRVVFRAVPGKKPPLTTGPR
jgi:hypothetical protein